MLLLKYIKLLKKNDVGTLGLADIKKKKSIDGAFANIFFTDCSS